MGYMYTIEYFSGIKKCKTVSSVEKWMEFETAVVSEISQNRKLNIPCFLLYEESKI